MRQSDPLWLASLTWPEAAARAGSTVLAVPVGSTEQHGPHLPLSTDTDIAVFLAQALAEARSDVAVAPAVAYGSSGEHADFPGTLSVGQEVVEALLVELGRSADAFAGMVVISAHGGNAEPVGRAARRLCAEGRQVLAWSPPAGDPRDSHAGRIETSVLLALGGHAVRMDRMEAGDVRPIRSLMPALRAGGVASVSPNGVLGDPHGASAALGDEVLASWVSQLVGAVDGLLG